MQVEKYRPTLVSDIVGNKDAVERLQVVSEEGNMPNLILAVRKTPPFSKLTVIYLVKTPCAGQ